MEKVDVAVFETDERGIRLLGRLEDSDLVEEAIRRLVAARRRELASLEVPAREPAETVDEVQR